MLRRSAFSLVELSIVLVILGLLVGGILAGQSLIRAAEIRSIATDLTKIQTAAHSFRDRYFSLPGDFTKASNIWGLAGGFAGAISSACLTANVDPNNLRTCDGNGNGSVHYTHESWLFFEHLALAGLIEGTYAGGDQDAPHGRSVVTGINSFKTRLPNVAIQAMHTTSYDIESHVLHIASDQEDVAVLSAPAIRSAEAWNLDTKMDDGHASRGRFMAVNARPLPAGNHAWCTTNVSTRFDNTPAGGAQYSNLDNAYGTGCIARYLF